MTSPQDAPLRLQDVYRPPLADEAPPSASGQRNFYVVSRTKFLVLFFATFGAYQTYWFFANWRRYRDRTGTALHPFWRAIFSPFFVHKLFALIAGDALRTAASPDPEAVSAPAVPEPTLRAATSRAATSRAIVRAPGWNHSSLATLYLVLVIASWVTDRLGDSVLIDILSTALGLATAYPLLRAQNAANIASDDPAGASNSRMTTINYVFIAMGLLLWPLFVFGLATPTE